MAKTLVLKTIKVQEGAPETNYKEFIKACVNYVKAGDGVTAEDQRKRLRILDAVEASGEELTLEDADAANLKDLVSKMIWSLVSPALVQFCDDVAAM